MSAPDVQGKTPCTDRSDSASERDPVDLDEIERLAKAATPDGPWKQGERDTHRVIDAHGFIVAEALSRPAMDGRSQKQRASDQAAYLAALDPATVLALVALARRAQEAEDHVAALLDGLDQNGEGDVCGLSLEEWERRTKAARAFLEKP